jgi:hypothetical protein
MAIRATCLGSWLIAGIIIGLRVFRDLPTQWGSVSVLFIGAGIASSVALSRMSLATTITDAFTAGLRAASAPREQTACVVEVSELGVIERVENPEVIHWDKGELEGLPLDAIIPPRFRAAHREGFERYRETGEAHVAGHSLAVPVLGHYGNEYAMRLTISRVGSKFTGNLVPTTERVGDTEAVMESIQQKAKENEGR